MPCICQDEFLGTPAQARPSTSAIKCEQKGVWRVYREAAEQTNNIHLVAYTTFCYFWRTLVPSIVVMKPQFDLCWQCQQNRTAITRSVNSSDSEKSAVINNALEHLRIVKMERAHSKSKDSIHCC